MPKDYSPFTPGYVVPVEFFAGRKKEVEKLRDKVLQAASGRLQVAFLSGERGIGKSSLAHFVKALVERESRVLGIHVFLGGVTTLEELVRKLFDQLLKDSVEKAWHEKIKDVFGTHIKQVGLFGVSLEFGASREDLRKIANDIVPALQNLTDRLKDDRKGMFIILDDINGLADSETFANWLKSTIDGISTSSKQLPLCLLLVGYEERRQSLIRLQPSLARVFDLIEINTWSFEETNEFFKNAFKQAGVLFGDDAIGRMSKYAGGLPVLAHEIGDAVYNIDEDNYISIDDTMRGLLQAADIVGRKHLEPQVLNAIQSRHYRTILKKVGTEPFEFHFQRGKVRASLGKLEERVFDNFLRKMSKLGVITREPEKGSGYYRFSNLLHYLYFVMQAR
ncbi:MAG TPA: ATP-binding protein [Bacteroidetes bacterium]|nr:ATP-binding protein [Bacteroidota bacterium]